MSKAVLAAVSLSPTHTRRRGGQYRYYVAQRVPKGQDADDTMVARVSAAEIEAVVTDQVRALLRQPEVPGGDVDCGALRDAGTDRG